MADAEPRLEGALQLTFRLVEEPTSTVGAPGAAGAVTTAMSKVSLTVPPLLSSAVTLTDTVPTSAAAGVPEKVRVEAVNVSQAGSAVPSDFVAV